MYPCRMNLPESHFGGNMEPRGLLGARKRVSQGTIIRLASLARNKKPFHRLDSATHSGVALPGMAHGSSRA